MIPNFYGICLVLKNNHGVQLGIKNMCVIMMQVIHATHIQVKTRVPIT